MTDKELRKLNRAELLQLMLEQSREVDRLREENASLRSELENRRIAVSESGSIAEAAIKINGVFEAAQKAAEQYLENVMGVLPETEEPKTEEARTEVQPEVKPEEPPAAAEEPAPEPAETPEPSGDELETLMKILAEYGEQ